MKKPASTGVLLASREEKNKKPVSTGFFLVP
jgi:hypothetical protein